MDGQDKPEHGKTEAERIALALERLVRIQAALLEEAKETRRAIVALRADFEEAHNL